MRRFEWTGERRVPKAGEWYVDPATGSMHQCPFDFQGRQGFDIYRANCPAGVPLEAICFWRDGEQWCCAMGDWSEEGVAPLGRGETREEAERDLIEAIEGQADELRTVETRAKRGRDYLDQVAGELRLVQGG